MCEAVEKYAKEYAEEYAKEQEKEYAIRERGCSIKLLMKNLQLTLASSTQRFGNPRHRAELDNRPITEAIT